MDNFRIHVLCKTEIMLGVHDFYMSHKCREYRKATVYIPALPMHADERVHKRYVLDYEGLGLLRVPYTGCLPPAVVS